MTKAKEKVEVLRPEDEDLVGLISQSRKKFFQGGNFGFKEAPSSLGTEFTQFSGLTTIRTFLPSSDGKLPSYFANFISQEN